VPGKGSRLAKTWCGVSDARRHAGTAADSSLNAEENNFLAAVARLAIAWALPRSIFDRRVSCHGVRWRSAGQRIQEELEQLRQKKCYTGLQLRYWSELRECRCGASLRWTLRLPLGFVGLRRHARETRVPSLARRRLLAFPGEDGLRLLWTTGSSLPTTPFRSSRTTSACFRWRASALQERARRPRRRRDSLYIRSTQRGTLDHVDAFGSTSDRIAWCSMR